MSRLPHYGMSVRTINKLFNIEFKKNESTMRCIKPLRNHSSDVSRTTWNQGRGLTSNANDFHPFYESENASDDYAYDQTW